MKREMAAGRRELAVPRRDQLNEQLRDLRALARRLVKAGKTKEARRALAAIQELEAASRKLERRP